MNKRKFSASMDQELYNLVVANSLTNETSISAEVERLVDLGVRNPYVGIGEVLTVDPELPLIFDKIDKLKDDVASQAGELDRCHDILRLRQNQLVLIGDELKIDPDPDKILSTIRNLLENISKLDDEIQTFKQDQARIANALEEPYDVHKVVGSIENLKVSEKWLTEKHDKVVELRLTIDEIARLVGAKEPTFEHIASRYNGLSESLDYYMNKLPVKFGKKLLEDSDEPLNWFQKLLWKVFF